jgi:hypothetical protein
MEKIKSARELLEIAGATSSQVLPDEIAETLPMASKSAHNLYVIILYYREIPRKELIYPPHYMMILDAVLGKVVRFEPCTPDSIGVKKPVGIPEEGYGLDPNMSAREFWEKTDRFLDLSKTIWQIYISDNMKMDSQTKNIIKEYYSIFEKIAKKPLLPYYHAIASDFLDWLSRNSK